MVAVPFEEKDEGEMANNYLQFSEAISQLTEEERAWCEARLRHLEEALPAFDKDGENENSVPGAPEDEPYLSGVMCLGFQWSIDREQDGYCLWMYAEESGDVEHVALFAQEFLARFRPHDYFTLTWAETCSKPRIGEFSGGAIFVTAEETAWNGAFSWIDEKTTKFNQRKEIPEASEDRAPASHSSQNAHVH